jgi:uncharacterized membrane protein YkvA (DUF1232 family)
MPDFLPVLGFTDDAAFLAAAIKLVTDHTCLAARALSAAGPSASG